MERHIIEKIQGFGYSVYMRNENDSFLVYTDGKRIAYLEAPRYQHGGINIGTKHKPAKEIGSGFSVYRDISDFDKDHLEKALEPCAFGIRAYGLPASAADRVVPYAGIDDLRASSRFDAEYKLVEA